MYMHFSFYHSRGKWLGLGWSDNDGVCAMYRLFSEIHVVLTNFPHILQQQSLPRVLLSRFTNVQYVKYTASFTCSLEKRNYITFYK